MKAVIAGFAATLTVYFLVATIFVNYRTAKLIKELKNSLKEIKRKDGGVK